jgi:uncharacterized membrane protein HdeD (DUF308 family)
VRLTLSILALGSALCVVGVALLSVPVALIVAGVALVGFALIREDGAA